MQVTLYQGAQVCSLTGLTNPITLSVDTGWKGAFEGLPMYDASGAAITCTAVETEVKLGDVTKTGAEAVSKPRAARPRSPTPT